MDATLLAMVRALYPDHTEIRWVPDSWVRVMYPVWEDPAGNIFKAPPDNPEEVVIKSEEVPVEHEICEGCGVWVGYSELTHIVFARMEGI